MPWELLHVELGSDSPRGWGRDKEGLLSRWHGGQGVVTAGHAISRSSPVQGS